MTKAGVLEAIVYVAFVGLALLLIFTLAFAEYDGWTPTPGDSTDFAGAPLDLAPQSE